MASCYNADDVARMVTGEEEDAHEICMDGSDDDLEMGLFDDDEFGVDRGEGDESGREDHESGSEMEC